MERLIHIYGLLAIVLFLMNAAGVVYLWSTRPKGKAAAETSEPVVKILPGPEHIEYVKREETKAAIVFRDRDNYIINIIKK